MTNGTTTDVTRESGTRADTPWAPHFGGPVGPVGPREAAAVRAAAVGAPAHRGAAGPAATGGRTAGPAAPPAASPLGSPAAGRRVPGGGSAPLAAVPPEAPAPLRPVRGRHRKPRPRRVLFAVGGLALAAGALSLVRMAPDSVVGGAGDRGNTEAEPRPGSATGEAIDATPTVWTVPSAHPASPGATAAPGGPSATPASAAGPSLAPTAPSATPWRSAMPSARAGVPAGGAPDATGIPTAPVVPARPRTRPPAASAPAPHPTPSATPRAPAPKPGQNPPGLCVPIVGICVNDLTGPAGGH